MKADKRSLFSAGKAHAFKTVLQPAGFKKGKHLFVRTIAGQIQGVEFQPSEYGTIYFVNVAFHYEFLPAFGAVLTGAAEPAPTDFDLLDFMLYTRLEQLMPDNYPAKWPKTEGTEVKMDMEKIARDAISVLDPLAAKWSDPSIFLELLRPTLLREEERVSAEREPLSDDEYFALPPSPYERAMNGAWGPPFISKFSYYLALISAHARRPELIKDYFAIAQAYADRDFPKVKILQALKAKLE